MNQKHPEDLKKNKIITGTINNDNVNIYIVNKTNISIDESARQKSN